MTGDEGSISLTALLTALALLRQRQGGTGTLHLDNLPVAGSGGDAVRDALVLGFLAGQVAHRGAGTPSDASSFLMDRELVVNGAEGDSVLRLPWVDEDLFVGRALPDIQEMPAHVRRLCIENYRAGLAGESRSFAFSSYGHAYTVESVPVYSGTRVNAVLGIARPAPRVKYRPPAQLTPREAELLQLAARGLSGPQIADHLNLSAETVRTHFRNVYEKWDVSDRAAAVAEAFRCGLVD